jgi:hypothetical protein
MSHASKLPTRFEIILKVEAVRQSTLGKSQHLEREGTGIAVA